MFGYIQAYPGELKVCEWEAYRAVYCGLCRRLGHRFGPLARLTLSYDFTFLAMLGMALDENDPTFCTRSCGVNPLRRCRHCEDSERLDDSCDIAVLTLWHKLQDNIADGGFWTRWGMRCLRPLLKKPYREAAARYPELAALFSAEMEHQRRLEAAGCQNIDEACEPTARMMEAVFGSLTEDAAQKRILQRMGYLMGRYIYLADALDDHRKDRESGSYNPFLCTEGEESEILARAKSSLYLTIGEIGATYELLSLQRFAPILANVVHLGLRHTADTLELPRKQRRKRYT